MLTVFRPARPLPFRSKRGFHETPKTVPCIFSSLLSKPYDRHGKQVSEEVTLVSWTAASKEAALQDAHFDEFTRRGKLPEAAGPLGFKVLQTCENGCSGRNDWSELPATGVSLKGLKFSAVLLEVTGHEAVAATDSVPAHALGAHQH